MILELGIGPGYISAMCAKVCGSESVYSFEANPALESLIWRASRAIRVPVKPFNEIPNGIRPTFLVIDIEGGEYAITRYMELDGVRAVAIESHPEVLGEDKAKAVCETFSAQSFVREERLTDKRHVLFERAIARSPVSRVNADGTAAQSVNTSGMTLHQVFGPD